MYISLLSHNAGKRDFTFSDLGVIMQVCRWKRDYQRLRMQNKLDSSHTQ